MPEMPWDMIVRSQRAAAGLLADTVGSMVELGRTGVTHPDEALRQMMAVASAVGELAGATALPLEYFLASQRQLAESMQAFAVLQRQLADVMETAAANHAAIVQSLEMLTNPVIAVADTLRGEKPGEKPGEKAGDKPGGSGKPASKVTVRKATPKRSS